MIKAIRVAETNYPGVTEITADGWDGRIFRMSLATCRKWIGSVERPKTAGVYLLYAGHFDRAIHGNQLYVGQSGTIGQRLGQHIGVKEFWTAVMVFTSAADWMNVAFTANIERQFIEWAQQANRYELDNGDGGREEYLGPDDKLRLESFLDSVRPVLRLANIDVFEPNMDGVFSCVDGSGSRSHLKIASGPPNPVVTILAGSMMFKLDHALVTQANLSGVTYDAAGDIYTFSKAVDVALNDWDVWSPRLFGRMTGQWKSEAGVTVNDALRQLAPLGPPRGSGA